MTFALSLKETKKPSKVKYAPVPNATLKEYAALVEEVGFKSSDVELESFKSFLATHDIPVFNLKEVIKYMDERAKKESKNGIGWEWQPLRAKDHRDMKWGTKSVVEKSWNSSQQANELKVKKVGSDFYEGPHDYMEAETAWVPYSNQLQQQHFAQIQAHSFINEGMAVPTFNGVPNGRYEYTGRQIQKQTPSPVKVYDRVVPMHALEKAALIEKHWGDKVCLFVSDYLTDPHVVEYPDPFLMAVIPTAQRLDEGNGRFVIDLWDEPGFGLLQRLA